MLKVSRAQVVCKDLVASIPLFVVSVCVCGSVLSLSLSLSLSLTLCLQRLVVRCCKLFFKGVETRLC